VLKASSCSGGVVGDGGGDVADVADGEDVVVGIVEDCSEDEDEDACNTMRCSKDSQKAVVLVASRRNNVASRSRLHVWTFGGKRMLSSGTATGAANDEEVDAEVAAVAAAAVDAVAAIGDVVMCEVPVSTAVTRSIQAHISTGVSMRMRMFDLPSW
jgi:hypothetical protein